MCHRDVGERWSATRATHDRDRVASYKLQKNIGSDDVIPLPFLSEALLHATANSFSEKSLIADVSFFSSFKFRGNLPLQFLDCIRLSIARS